MGNSSHLVAKLSMAGIVSGCATVSSHHIGAPPQQLVTAEPLKAQIASECTNPNEDCVQNSTAPVGVPSTDVKPGAGAPAVNQSSRVRGHQASSSGGVTYFLPRQLARVTASRTSGTLNDAVKGVIQAHSEVQAAKSLIDSLKSVIRQTEDAAIAAAAGSPATSILSARLAGQKVDLEAAKAALPSKEAALNDAKATLVEAGKAGSSKAYKVALKIELLSPTADLTQAFRLSPEHTPFRDDEQKLVVSAAGLLTSTDITSTDRTADILMEIAAFAGAITGGKVPVLTRDGRPEGTLKDCSKAPSEFTGVVDFADAASVKLLNDDLQCLGVRTVAEGHYWPGDTRPESSAARPIQGIVYRTPVQVQVRVEKCTDPEGTCGPTNGWYATEVLALTLPQAGPIAYVRQDAGFMTKTKYTLAFSDGILVNYSSSRPSELLEVARTPMRLVNGLFEGASKIVSLRTGQNNTLAAEVASRYALDVASITGQKSQYEAELARLKAKYDLEAGASNGQRLLFEAELAALNSRYALQTGQLNNERLANEAQKNLILSQFGVQAASLEGRKTLSIAETALLVQLLTGPTGVANAELALIQANAGQSVGQNNSTAQLSSSDLALYAALTRDQAKRDNLSRCINEKAAAGQTDIQSCLVGF